MGPQGQPPSAERHGTARGKPAAAPSEASASAGKVQSGRMVLVPVASAGREGVRVLKLGGMRDAGALLCAAPARQFYLHCCPLGLPQKRGRCGGETHESCLV